MKRLVSEEKIRQNLIRLRKKHGMKQEDVAKLLCISRSGYAHYELGDVTPSYIILKQLAVIYHISMEMWDKDDTA